MSMMKSIRKPPLAKSPIRLRSRRVLRSNSTALQTPPGSLTKSEKPIRDFGMEASDLRPEYRSISCELRALAKMVQNELGEVNTTGKAGFGTSLSANSTPLFERGRFYEEYTARRNERLKRKKNESGDPVRGTPYNLGVTMESSKRRDSKKLESLKKSVSAAYSVERSQIQTPRYMLRSMSKGNKKPPMAAGNSSRSEFASERKTTTVHRGRKI